MSPAKSPIDDAVRRIVDAVQPEAVFLFGSRARGDAGEGSDWDLFVVVPDDVAPGTVTPSRLRRLLNGMGVAFDVVACRRSVFEDRKADPNSLSHDVVEDGVLLYERQPRA
ncbi:MAG TPA: nucleotidyltransferase domain-containing protein [Azospirillum sp.]|nr:nucleotidyltransferase domain-containing protein [Azospirillum sp.]